MSAEETVGPPLIQGLQYKALLGSGGFAHVHRYEQTALGRDVAVKVLHGLDEAARRHFASEANLMARLSSHPHVVPVYQVGVSDDDRPFLVMQLCASPTLSDRLRARPLPVAEVLQIGVQVAGAVETAHRLGILHRDIKPANILFSEYGRPLLADFGIAQSLEATAEPVPAFSPAWAPPEQAIGQGFAAATDVYSLSATLWAALTGKPPLGPVRPGLTAVGTGRDDVPPALEDLLRSGLAEDPSDRPRTALDMARGLQRVQSQLGLSVTPVELWNDPQQQRTHAVETPDERTRVVTLSEPEPAPTVAEAGLVGPAPSARPGTTPWAPPAVSSAPARAPHQPSLPPPAVSAPVRRERHRPWLPWLLLLLLLVALALAVLQLWPRGGEDPATPATPAPATSAAPATTSAPRTTQPAAPPPTSATESETSQEAPGGGLGGEWEG